MNEFHCEACNLYFAADLRPTQVSFCPLCGYQSPESIPKQLTTEEFNRLVAQYVAELNEEVAFQE